MRSRLLGWTSAFVVALAAIDGKAAPEPSPRDETSNTAAEALFQEGRKLIEAKRYGEACPKFLASHKLAPAHGTLLNLADCYEKNGQIASAWARFHEAIALAQRLNRADREKTARDRADKLEPRLIRLTIVAKDPDAEVKLDGNALDAAVLGTPVPVDPGKHTVDASAKGKRPYSATVEVSEKNKSPALDIPALEDEPSSAPPAEGGPPKKVETPGDDERGGSNMKTIGIAVGAVGLAGIGIGSFFGIRASDKWKDAKARCNSSYECDPTGVDLADQARSAGNIATLGFIAGGALLVAGVVLFVTAPSGKSATKMNVGVGPGSLLFGGSF
jgi:tetratricopeptide (TPR) repeat protein